MDDKEILNNPKLVCAYYGNVTLTLSLSVLLLICRKLHPEIIKSAELQSVVESFNSLEKPVEDSLLDESGSNAEYLHKQYMELILSLKKFKILSIILLK